MFINTDLLKSNIEKRINNPLTIFAATGKENCSANKIKKAPPKRRQVLKTAHGKTNFIIAAQRRNFNAKRKNIRRIISCI